MGKKSSKLPIIYLIGVLAVAIGFCLPLFKGKLLGATTTGWDFISFKDFDWSSFAAILIFLGAVLGAVFCFVKAGKNTNLLRLVCIIVSIVGGLIFIIKFNDDSITKLIGKQILKCATVGFYTVIAGWIVGLIGAITHK